MTATASPPTATAAAPAGGDTAARLAELRSRNRRVSGPEPTAEERQQWRQGWQEMVDRHERERDAQHRERQQYLLDLYLTGRVTLRDLEAILGVARAWLQAMLTDQPARKGIRKR